MNTNKLPAEAGHPEVNAAGSLWNEFLDQLPVAYIEVNEHGVISRANQRAIDIHPAEAGALVGQLVWEYLPTETQEVACAQFFQMMESGEDPPPAHLHLYTSGGEFRLFDVRRNLMRDDVGKPIGMRAVSFDITEAHQAEKETRKRMQWLESAFDSAQDAVVLTDAMGMVSYVNPATEKILGKMRDELLGKPVEEDFPRVAYSSADGEVLTHNLAMNHATRGVVTVLDAQKREVRLAITTTPILDKKTGYTAGVIGILRPEASGPSELIEELPVAYCEINAQGVIVRANREARAMHPPELGEIVGQSIWDLLPADQKKISRKSFLAMIESGHEPPVVVRSIYTTDGEYRTYELHRSLMRNDQGAVLGMRYVGFDASEAHAALHKSEQARMWIEGAYAAMAEAVVVTDTLGTICMINRAAEELLGWKSAELVGKMLEEQLRLASPSPAAEGGLDHRAALTIRSTGKATVLDGNRRPVRLELSASPIVDTEKGFTVGVVYELRRAED